MTIARGEKKLRAWKNNKEWKKGERNENVDVEINLILALYDSIRLECVPLISRCRHVKYCRGQYASWTNYDSKKAHTSCAAAAVTSTDINFSFHFSAKREKKRVAIENWKQKNTIISIHTHE